MATKIQKANGSLQTTDGGAVTLDIAVPSNSVMAFVAHIVPKVSSSNVGGLIVMSGSIHNNGGTVALDNVVVAGASILAAAIALVTAVFTANSTNLRLTVTGVALIGVIDWEYHIDFILND